MSSSPLLRGPGPLALLLAALLAAAAPAAVIVDRVEPGSLAERAGAAAGDVLQSWSLGAPGASPTAGFAGAVASFDWSWLQSEVAPRGAVTLSGRRGSAPRAITLAGPPWGLEICPELSGAVLATYRRGQQALAGGDPAAAIAAWQALAAPRSARRDPELTFHLRLLLAEARHVTGDLAGARADLEAARAAAGSAASIPGQALALRRLADLAAGSSEAERAEESLSAAIAVLEAAPRTELTLAETLMASARLATRAGDMARARPLFERALSLREAVLPDSILVAESLGSVAAVADALGDATTEKAATTRAVSILARLAPGSLELARILHNHGLASAGRGELEEAEDSFRKALVIRAAAAPGSAAHGKTAANLGAVVAMQGRLADAEALQTEALKIAEQAAPGSTSVADALNNLANTVSDRGDLARAEALQRRALAIYEKLAPDSPAVATALNNLGGVVGERRDFASARTYLERALEIEEKLGADPIDLAGTLSNLAVVAGELGDVTRAVELHGRALSLAETVDPGGLSSARILLNRGSLFKKAGDLPRAEASYRDSLAIFTARAPGGVSAADVTSLLGETAWLRGDLTTAVALSESALATLTVLAPGSTKEAATWHQLGQALREQGKPEEALEAFRKAVAALEVQTSRLGGGEGVGADFRADYRGYYQDLIDLLLERGRPEEAYENLERSRARVLLAMLADRDLSFAADGSPDLETRARSLSRETVATLSALSGLDPVHEPDQVAAASARLEELRVQRAELNARLRAASPRLAALRDPQPLDVKAARAALDPGVVVLAYSVGEHRSWLLTLSKDRGLKAVELPIGRAALGARIRAWRHQLQAVVGTAGPSLSELARTSRELGDLLLAPAAAEIGHGKRLVLLPDGPLHILPFAALRLTCPGSTRESALVECRPATTALSVTLLAELSRERPAPAPGRAWSVVAFGDPAYPTLPAEGVDAVANPELRAALRRGATLESLPATRTEVLDIATVFGEPTSVFLGERATEARAKAVSPGTRVLHFACHGLLDEDFPLASSLALTLRLQPGEGEDNGLLQAWEILEGVRLHADLVTLSACQTALGREVGGEGMIGLSRAFHYAGARTVLASLWSVADESTAALMQHFYSGLKNGLPKDEALRQAQLALLKKRPEAAPDPASAGAPADFSHPFFWAAFELSGDWQ